MLPRSCDHAVRLIRDICKLPETHRFKDERIQFSGTEVGADSYSAGGPCKLGALAALVILGYAGLVCVDPKALHGKQRYHYVLSRQQLDRLKREFEKFVRHTL